MQNQLTPPQGIQFRQVSASLSETTCGVAEDESIQCWGGRSNRKSLPTHDGRFLQVSAGSVDGSICAITVTKRSRQCTHGGRFTRVTCGNCCCCLGGDTAITMLWDAEIAHEGPNWGSRMGRSGSWSHGCLCGRYVFQFALLGDWSSK